MRTEANRGRGTETDLRMGSETQEWSGDRGRMGQKDTGMGQRKAGGRELDRDPRIKARTT